MKTTAMILIITAATCAHAQENNSPDAGTPGSAQAVTPENSQVAPTVVAAAKRRFSCQPSASLAVTLNRTTPGAFIPNGTFGGDCGTDIIAQEIGKRGVPDIKGTVWDFKGNASPMIYFTIGTARTSNLAQEAAANGGAVPSYDLTTINDRTSHMKWASLSREDSIAFLTGTPLKSTVAYGKGGIFPFNPGGSTDPDGKTSAAERDLGGGIDAGRIGLTLPTVALQGGLIHGLGPHSKIEVIGTAYHNTIDNSNENEYIGNFYNMGSDAYKRNIAIGKLDSGGVIVLMTRGSSTFGGSIRHVPGGPAYSFNTSMKANTPVGTATGFFGASGTHYPNFNYTPPGDPGGSPGYTYRNSAESGQYVGLMAHPDFQPIKKIPVDIFALYQNAKGVANCSAATPAAIMDPKNGCGTDFGLVRLGANAWITKPDSKNQVNLTVAFDEIQGHHDTVEKKNEGPSLVVSLRYRHVPKANWSKPPVAPPVPATPNDAGMYKQPFHESDYIPLPKQQN